MGLRYGTRLFRGFLPASILVSTILFYLTWTMILHRPTPQLITSPKAVLSSYISPSSSPSTPEKTLAEKPLTTIGDKSQKWPGQDLDDWKKPEGLRVVGLIFFGRRDFTSILDCYLRRNLVRNGGMLDEVIFVVRTEQKLDLEWLDQALLRTPEYTKSEISVGRGRNFSDAYNICERGTMYIKMDDDIVFIEDLAIPAIVQRRYQNPQYLLVSANSLNQPAITWVHYHLNAMRPYFPELAPPDPSSLPSTPSWRASELPTWTGPPSFNISELDPAPFQNHRWLPLPAGSDIDLTPASVVDYYAAGAGFHSWVVGAQTHYSFLENLEKEELWRYKFDLWDYHYDRLSINFVAFMGEDILDNGPVPGSDEWYLAKYLPTKLKRHVVLDGRGLTVHFGFRRQLSSLKGQALGWTDALSRYRAYAEENICIDN